MKVALNKHPIFLHSEKSLHYLANGNIVKAFCVTLPEAYRASDKDFENYQKIWFNSFRKLPTGVVVHIQNWFFDEKYDATQLNGKHFIDKETAKHFANRSYLQNVCFLFYILPKGNAFNSSMSNPFKKGLSSSELKKESSRISSFLEAVQRSIDYIIAQQHFIINEVEQETLTHLRHLYFNGMYSDIITDTDLINFEGGERKIGVMAIRHESQFGDNVSTSIPNLDFSDKNFTYHKGFLDDLGFNIKCNHITNLIFKIKDTKATRDKIAKHQSNMHGARGFNKDLAHKAEKLNEIVSELFNNDSLQFIDCHFNIIFWEELEKYKDTQEVVKSFFHNVDITAYLPTGKNKKNIFLNSFFAYSTNLDEDNIIKNFSLEPATCLISNTGNYRNDSSGIFFQDRLFNIPVAVDVLYHSKAKNFGIVAPTGEGKSVTCLHLMFNIIEKYNGVGVIIDLGGSYRNLFRFFPKEDVAYISYEQGKNFGINIFLLDNEERLSTDKINKLVLFISIHWGKTLNETETTCLRKTIQGYYEVSERENLSFLNFYLFLKENKTEIYQAYEFNNNDLNIENLTLNLSNFFEDGAYSFLYENTKKDFSLTGKKLVVIELDKAMGDPTLLSILMLMISDIIEKNILSDRKKLGTVLLDEFAKLLKIQALFEIVEYYFQTMRKYEGSCGIVLQSPAQLPTTSNQTGNNPGEAMIENMQTLYILNNTDGYDSVAEKFKLSSHDKMQLLSIRNNYKGKPPLFSEIGIKRGKELNIYRLELPEKVLAAYETDGKTYTRINELFEETKDIEKAINIFITEKNNSL